MNKISFKTLFLVLLITSLIVYLCLTFKITSKKANKLFEVYLSGKKIGLIASSDELYNLIDEEQTEIKEKYNVDKVYPPSGLEIQSTMTYKNRVLTAKEVYEEIKDIDPFTIEGYEVSIKLDKGTMNFYILNKEHLDTAIKNTILAFVSKEEYDNYLEGKEVDITEEGKEITDIYFDKEVTIKRKYISTEENIITNENDLSMFFLFGTTNLTDKYEVKAEDTIETIAYKNELGVSDFLIANPEIKGENALLAIGQKVTVAGINPVSNIVVESFETENSKISYETKLIYDKTLDASKTYTKQEGKKGLAKVTYATKEMNGVILNTVPVSEEIISEPIDKIVVVGAKNIVYYGNTTYWAWPTSKPFRISSHFGYRIHPIYKENRLHNGTDITGTRSDNIYAIQSGTVINVGYHSSSGNYIYIKHNNTYTSTYLHLRKQLVKEGDKVEKGQLIGIMGNTGASTGKHLHLGLLKNGKYVNALTLYQ